MLADGNLPPLPGPIIRRSTKDIRGEIHIMRVRNPVVLFALLAMLAGCQAVTSYNPSYVPAEAEVATAERIPGKARIYMTEADRDYVFNAGASTFTGSGAKLSIPLGVMTWEIGKSVYGSAFSEGAEATHSIGNDPGYVVTIQPRASDFKYYYHQLENLGFAITPGAELTLTVALLDDSGDSIASLRADASSRGTRRSINGLGWCERIAPLPASTAAPMTPPRSTLPAMPAAPGESTLELTVAVASTKPSLVAQTMKSPLRLIFMLHGVTQVYPWLERTFAPCGSESMTMVS